MSKCIMCGEREWVSVGVCAQCLGLPEPENETKRFNPKPEDVRNYIAGRMYIDKDILPDCRDIALVLAALALMKLEAEYNE